MHLYDQGGFIPFPPYSRGWSDIEKIVQQWVMIFPVFAGMVPGDTVKHVHNNNFPRIRGDGPACVCSSGHRAEFSPYSRG